MTKSLRVPQLLRYSQYVNAQQLKMCHLLRGGRSCVGQDTAKLEVRPMSDELGNDMLERDGEDD